MLSRRTFVITLCVLVCAVMVGGCGSYYKVSDPTTGRVYYTEDLQEKDGGAVALRDGRDGSTVTIQNSSVQKISKEEFLADRGRSGQSPIAATPTAPPAAAAAPAAPAAADAALAGSSVGAVTAMAASPDQLRADLVQSKTQIDQCLSALTELADPNQTDLRASYKRYGEQIERLSRQSQRIQAEADAMRQARSAYFAKWDAHIAQTPNPTIRAEAESRRTRLRAAQDRISADAAEAKEAFQPFMTNLQDVRTFLAKELSRDTTSILGPAVRKAQADGSILKQRLDAVIADLDALGG
jgi:hypothetical protein